MWSRTTSLNRASNQYHVKPAAHCCMPYLTLVVLLLHAVYCAAVVAAGPRLKLDPHEIYRLPSGFVRLGLPLAKGAFGTVLWGTGPDGQRLVAKRAAAKKARAEDYFEVEAQLNTMLHDAGATGSAHLAPFLGVCKIGWDDHLVWVATPGVEHTLGWYLASSDRACSLAKALGVEEPMDDKIDSELSRALLQEMLSGLALLHSHGVLHRDIKPENWLVDEATHSLRLIDLGSACTVQDIHGQVLIPTSSAWAPPELRLTAENPSAYDIYSTALVWLHAVLGASDSAAEFDVSALRQQESMLSLKDWLQKAVGVPQAMFGRSKRALWEVVVRMLDPDPTSRISAGEALCASIADHDQMIPEATSSCEEDFSCRLPSAQGEECSLHWIHSQRKLSHPRVA